MKKKLTNILKYVVEIALLIAPLPRYKCKYIGCEEGYVREEGHERRCRRKSVRCRCAYLRSFARAFQNFTFLSGPVTPPAPESPSRSRTTLSPSSPTCGSTDKGLTCLPCRAQSKTWAISFLYQSDNKFLLNYLGIAS